MANTFSVHYPEIWSGYMAKNFDAESVALQYCNHSVESDISSEGDTVRVTKFGDITVGNYSVGSDISDQDVTSTSDTLTLDQIKSFRFVIDDTEKARASNKIDLVKGYTGRAKVAMAQTLDTFLLAKSADVSAGNVVGSASAPITLTADNIYDYFVQMGQILDEDNIPPESRYALIDPSTKALILKSPDFVKNTAMGDGVVRNGMKKIHGKIGEMAGFDVVLTNRQATTAGVKDLLFAHREFLSVAVRFSPTNFATGRTEKRFADYVQGMMFYGAKVFNPTAGAVLKKAA